MSDTPPPRKARTRRLSCPGCGGSIEVRASGISISAICASCGRTVDVASDDLRIISEGARNTRTLAIPIGTRGTLVGTEWEVVGYQARSNPAEGWTWDEYLLFNPYRGFRFLAHDDEGWTLFCMLRQEIPDPSHVDGDHKHYRGPESSQARTDYVLGEFYWRVRVGDMAQVDQYEAGSSFLVKETTGDEIIWSRGVKLPMKDVRAAFNLAPTETAVVSPRQHTIAVLWTGVAACVLLILLYSMSFGGSAAAPIFEQDYRITAANRGKPIASAPFTVPNRGGNLRLDLYAPVQNTWVSINLSLVGDGGTPVFDASRTIEYYTGYDSDGSWEEGGREAQVMFRSIPGGVYRLLVDADTGVFADTNNASGAVSLGDTGQNVQSNTDVRRVDFSITARRHVTAPEWFWFGLLLIVPYPVFRLLFRRKPT